MLFCHWASLHALLWNLAYLRQDGGVESFVCDSAEGKKPVRFARVKDTDLKGSRSLGYLSMNPKRYVEQRSGVVFSLFW